MPSNFYNKYQITHADHTTTPIDCELFKIVSIQVSWADLDQQDGKYTPSFSNDGTNYVDGTPVNLNTADGSSIYKLDVMPYRFVKVTIDDGTNATGTYTISEMAKV